MKDSSVMPVPAFLAVPEVITCVICADGQQFHADLRLA